jgi:WD40 repeat protein
VIFSPDGQQMLTGSADGTARLWEASSGKLLSTLEGHQSGVNRVIFSPDGRLLVTGDDSGRVYCWANNGAQIGQVLALYPAAYRVLSLHWQDNHHLLLADDGGPRRKPNVYRLQLEGI